MKTLTQMGSDAKKASTYLAKLGIKERNNALLKVADALVKRSDYISFRQTYAYREQNRRNG